MSRVRPPPGKKKVATSAAPPAPGLFITSTDQYSSKLTGGYVHSLASDIAAGLSASGWSCAPVASWLDEELGGVFSGKLPPFVLNFNLTPRDVLANVRRDGRLDQVHVYRLLSEFLRIPVVCVLMDHAAHHLPNILSHPYASQNVRFAFFEKGSMPFLSGLGVPRERTVQMRWGGPPPDPNPKPFKYRSYDIVFHGSLHALKSEQEFIQAAVDLSIPAEMAGAALAAVERIVEGEEDIYAALLAALGEKGFDPAAVRIGVTSFLLQDIDIRSRRVRRERFLSAFADLPVNFFGQFPDSFKRKFKRAVFHGVKPYSEIMEISRDTKVTLCENLNWRDNIHPRVTYAMAQGGLVLAEGNNALRASFTDMKNIVMVSHPYRDAAEKADAVLKTPAVAQKMVESARSIYESRHTWREAVKALAPFLPPPVLPPPARSSRTKRSGSKSSRRK